MENMKFAVLIDCENISYRYVDIIMDELAKEGTITYRRIYGDWSDSKTRGWKEKLLENSIIPIQSFPYTSGKNSTDTTMVIDAMDILYTGKVDGFCLVSSDCDFTRLASRLKEAGMKVIGMGEQKTPPAFVAACSEFILIFFFQKLKKKRRVIKVKYKVILMVLQVKRRLRVLYSH